MAQRGQLASFFIQNGDLPARNAGLTDIPANTFVLVDTANPPTNDDVLAVVVPSDGGGVVGTFGITRTIIKAGATGSVCCLGGEVVKADGVITVGDYVQASDTTAKMGRAKTKGAGVESGGRALNSAADGEDVLVFVNCTPVA